MEENLKASPSLTTGWHADELDWSLNLNDFELSLVSDFISDAISPDDETLAVSSLTNVELSDMSIDLPQHRSKSPENSAMHVTLPAVGEAFPSSLPGRRYTGVTRQPGGKFGAKINVTNLEKKRKTVWLGTYCTAEEAAMAFDRAAYKYRGSQTVLNFPRLVGTHDENPKSIPPRKGRRSRGFLDSVAGIIKRQTGDKTDVHVNL